MKLLYLECNMGAAGDMLTGALLELLDEEKKRDFISKMNGLGLPGVRVLAEKDEKRGITGTHVRVLVEGEEEDCVEFERHDHPHRHEHSGRHEHFGMLEAEELILHMELPEKVKDDALAVYGLLSKAESSVHGVPVAQIHFHELGTLDAMADIVGVCLLMNMLAPDRVAASAVHVGCGQVRCAHGVLPVPAPATALLLTGVPVYGGTVRGELCTPTGAALLKHFVQSYGGLPAMVLRRIGCGTGTKDFETANCVRAFWGDSGEAEETVLELCCNLDDMTPEAIGFAQERLLEEGALDVYTTAIGMKKSRPGVLLTCLCKEQRRQEMTRLLFKHTTTLGVRSRVCERCTLHRETRAVWTEYGEVRVKRASGYGVAREKCEYEDAARIARETGTPLYEIIAGLTQKE